MEIVPRSPLMIVISIVYMMFDTIGNTVLFSIDPSKNFKGVCYMGVLLTVVCQFGFLCMIFLRCYRLFAVFSYYEGYLKEQKRVLIDEAENIPESRATMIDDGRITITSRDGESPFVPANEQVSETADAFFDNAFAANQASASQNRDQNTSFQED